MQHMRRHIGLFLNIEHGAGALAPDNSQAAGTKHKHIEQVKYKSLRVETKGPCAPFFFVLQVWCSLLGKLYVPSCVQLV